LGGTDRIRPPRVQRPGQSQEEAAKAPPIDQEIKEMCRVQKCLGGLVTVALAVLSLVRFPATLDGQEFMGRSRIEVRLGLGVRANSGTTTSGNGIHAETEAAGLLGSIAYAHWWNEGFALTGSAGLLSSEAKMSAGTGTFRSRSASVVMLFFGARRYFPKSTSSSAWRPFASGEVGPVIGSQSWLEHGGATAGESITTAALGLRLGAGVDIHLGGRTVLGMSAGYDLMTDFPDAIGGRKNHSGPDLGLSIGVQFGGSSAQEK